MVRVKIWGSLRALVDGRAYLEVDAKTLKDVIDEIEKNEPALRPQLQRGVSFSVDGLIYSDSWCVPLSGDEEVVMLPRLVGG